jgi:hypothetical protein
MPTGGPHIQIEGAQQALLFRGASSCHTSEQRHPHLISVGAQPPGWTKLAWDYSIGLAVNTPWAGGVNGPWL